MTGSVLGLPQLGDLDSDGRLTVLDLVRLINHYRGVSILAPEVLPLADLNQDGVINDADASLLASIIAGASPPSLPLSHLLRTSPLNGTANISVTRPTEFVFSMPLASTVVVTTNNLYATFGGRRFLSRVEISDDRRKVSLFYLEPLSGNARIRVTFNASGLLDFLGRPVDVIGDGTANATLTLDFDTVNNSPLPNTVVVGRVFASELTPTKAAINQLVNQPLAGVTVTVDGQEQNLRAVTDNLGNFRLDPAPAGIFFVHIDGRTATNAVPGGGYPNGAYYPFVGKEWQSTLGEEVSIGNVYLPLIQAGTLEPISLTQPTIVTFPSNVLAANPELAGVSITVPQNALFSDDGTRGGRVGIAPVPPDRLPSPLPSGLQFALVITVQTDGGQNFSQPVPACFPNLPDPVTGQTLPPGAKTALWSFNHRSGQWEIQGPMTISADGKFACTDPGTGIPMPGWHGAAPGTQAKGPNILPGRGGNRPGQPQPGSDQEKGSGADQPHVPCNVLLHNGEETFDVTDLAIPGRGEINFAVQRTYRSRVEYNGPFGHNWFLSYNEQLYVQANNDILRVDNTGHAYTWKAEPNGKYDTPEGYYGTLVRHVDGTFVLREPNGFKRFYTADGLLYLYQDRNGNSLLFEYDDQANLSVVVDPYGREIYFSFEQFTEAGKPVFRISRITDFAGRTVNYTYDQHGDLIQVTSPAVLGTSTGNDFPGGRAERYTYSGGFPEPELNHNILTRTMPEEVAQNGPPAFVWTYGTNAADSLTFDRVIARTRGGTNASAIAAGGVVTFKYEHLNQDVPLGDLTVTRSKTTYTDRNGNVTEFFYNEKNSNILTRQRTRGFRPNEPDYYETRSIYDGDGKLLRRIFPEGNELRNTYGEGSRVAQQNLVETRRVAGPRGGGEDLVTTFTYEPLYNQLSSVTDARGNATAFTPSIGSASHDRYTTLIFFDYQEGTAPIPDVAEFGIDISTVKRGLGDLNNDRRTDQIAGNVVRQEAPPVQLLADSKLASRIGSTVQPIRTDVQWSDYGQKLKIIDPEGNVTTFEYYPTGKPGGTTSVPVSRYRFVDTTSAAGYLAATTIDSETSPRRTTTLAPVALRTVYRYDTVGNVTALRNPRGVWTYREVTALNETIVESRGADISEAVASNQLLTGETPFAYKSRTFYDANGRVVRTQVENRDSTTYGVGPYIERTYTYDILNKLIRKTLALADGVLLEWNFRYDPEELQILTVQPEGNQSAAVYDERNLPFQIIRGYGTASAATNRIDYDLNGNRTRFVDAEDKDGDGLPEFSQFAYDGFDRLVKRTDAVGNETRSTYDAVSNLTRKQVFGHRPGRPNAGNVLLLDNSFSYDEQNRIFQLDQPLFLSDGFTTVRPAKLLDSNSDGVITVRYEYDALSRKIFTIQDDLQASETRYDGASRAIAMIDPLGNQTLAEYDKNGNQTRVQRIDRSPEGVVPDEVFTTVNVFDQLDRLVRTTDNAGETSFFSYDSRDNLTTKSDPQGPLADDPLKLFPGAGQSGQINSAGNTTTYQYDAMDRRIAVITDLRQNGHGGSPLDLSNPSNADGQIQVSYVYDGDSRLQALVDDNGNRTVFEYDALDRKTSERYADDTSRQFVYDRDGNLRQSTDANGTVATNSYDRISRITTVQVNRAPGIEGTTSEIFEYDGLSRLTRRLDDNGGTPQITETVYDSLSRTLEERQNGQPVSSVWNGAGQRVSVVYPGGRTLAYACDANDRIKTITDSKGSLYSAQWIGAGYRPLSFTTPDGSVHSFLNDARNADAGYDAVARAIHERVLNPRGGPLLDREYAYNRASQRLSEKRSDDQGLTDSYTYDSAYRVTEAQYDSGGAPGAAPRDLAGELFQLDGAGNRRITGQTSRSGNQQTQNYTPNSVNEYTSVSGQSRNYDANGNLLDDGRLLYHYDYKNRLVSVFNKAGNQPVARYLYLGDNRRSEKVVYAPGHPGQAQEDTRFLYDHWHVCEEQSAASGKTTTTYVWGPGHYDALIETEHTADHPLGAAEFFAHQNGRADVVALTDSSGVVVERTRYDVYGNPDHASGVANPYLFQGQHFDAETGFYYFRNRYYNPQTGRFIQRDPAYDPVSAGNLYSFAGNNPASRVDPTGFTSFLDVLMAPSGKAWCTFKNWGSEIPGDAWNGLKSGLSALGNAIAHPIDTWNAVTEGVSSLRDNIDRALTPPPPPPPGMDPADAAFAMAQAIYDGDRQAIATGAAVAQQLALAYITAPIFDGLAELAGPALGTARAAIGGAFDAFVNETAIGGRVSESLSALAEAYNSTCKPWEGWCFTGETLVATPSGFTRIDEIRVGQRVISQDDGVTVEEPINPQEWLLVRAKAPNVQAPGDVIEISILRPASWVLSRMSEKGDSIYLQVPDLGIDGLADLLALESCPDIESGPGRVVLATFAHHNSFVLSIRVGGSNKPIHSTNLHRFRSKSRDDWIAANDLYVGETLVAGAGSNTILAKNWEEGTQRVYNIEVQGTHTYRVSISELIVHNACTYGPLDDLGRPTGVNGTVTKDMIGTGTPANPSIIPPGWSGNGTLFNEARGHLWGNQLGGSGDLAENLVTLQQNPANSPFMRGFETQVRQAVEAGETVQYSVTPVYNGNALAPQGLTISAKGSAGFSLDVTVRNPVPAARP